MTPWTPGPKLPANDPRLAALRTLGDQRRNGLRAADEALTQIEPLIRELRAAGEKKGVIAELGCVSRTHVDQTLDEG